MKNVKLTMSLLVIAILFLVSCSKDENNPTKVRTTSTEFKALKTASIESKMQNFQLDVSQTEVFTTESGVQFVINGNCLSNNGNPITGTADIKVIELFNSGDMVTTNKPTMGKMENGDKALLISGGEFFVSATQGDVQLQLDCPIQVLVPTNLTGQVDNEMILWKGIGIDEDCDLPEVCDNIVWEEIENGEVEIANGDNGETFYVSDFGEFGWTNVDRFYNDPRPKTTLLVDVPSGFNNKNSSVYIYYNGEPNALGELDTYIEEQGLFSEHYGQIPIGLECHIVFVSEDKGNWLFAIKPVTIASGDIITISDVDLNTATANELEALINDLP
ncbi:hypothetical protein [Tenacibaculum sp. 47A_GOM-205m]|uniref:hypothetical protein n=1 Tax=Tenacibaculum sp. 47A_GOM-205m TaxID=1380384 RepID=UPI00048FB97E|nr:hypothetical protein [Tenacibaculum sp. 47A_GOM-205m]